MADEKEFRKELEAAINRCSRENGSNTPDFILADYLAGCLAAFDNASRAREKWYGKSLSIGMGIGDLPSTDQTHCSLPGTGPPSE